MGSTLQRDVVGVEEMKGAEGESQVTVVAAVPFAMTEATKKWTSEMFICSLAGSVTHLIKGKVL
jgi:hypothetical protein